MKMRRALIAFGIFVLLVVAVQPAIALKLGGTLSGKYGSDLLNPQLAHVNAAASKLEGLLNAYASSIDRDRDNDIANKQVQIDDATRDLVVALDELNAVVLEAYPTLTKEEQLAVRQAYASLDSFLHGIVADAEANAVPAYLLSQIMQMNDTIKAVIQNLRV